MGRRKREARDTEKSVRQRVMATNCNLQFYGSIGEKQKQQQEQARSKPKQGRGRRQKKEKKQRSRGVAAAETEAATDTAAIQNKPI